MCCVRTLPYRPGMPPFLALFSFSQHTWAYLWLLPVVAPLPCLSCFFISSSFCSYESPSCYTFTAPVHCRRRRRRCVSQSSPVQVTASASSFSRLFCFFLLFFSLSLFLSFARNTLCPYHPSRFFLFCLFSPPPQPLECNASGGYDTGYDDERRREKGRSTKPSRGGKPKGKGMERMLRQDKTKQEKNKWDARFTSSHLISLDLDPACIYLTHSLTQSLSNHGRHHDPSHQQGRRRT